MKIFSIHTNGMAKRAKCCAQNSRCATHVNADCNGWDSYICCNNQTWPILPMVYMEPDGENGFETCANPDDDNVIFFSEKDKSENVYKCTRQSGILQPASTKSRSVACT